MFQSKHLHFPSERFQHLSSQVVSLSVKEEASKSLTEDTVCNISEYQEVEEVAFNAAEVVDPTDNTSSDRSCRDIFPLAEPDVSNSESSRAKSARSLRSVGENDTKSQTENIKKVTETNNSVLSTAVTEVSSFYDISYCSNV